MLTKMYWFRIIIMQTRGHWWEKLSKFSCLLKNSTIFQKLSASKACMLETFSMSVSGILILGISSINFLQKCGNCNIWKHVGNENFRLVWYVVLFFWSLSFILLCYTDYRNFSVGIGWKWTLLNQCWNGGKLCRE